MPRGKWYGVKVIGNIRGDTQKKLELAATYVEGQAILNISQGPTMAVDSGRLKNSITHETHKDFARIGTNVEYSTFVELGTVKMGPRPFLRLALINSLGAIKKIFGS